MCLLFIDFADFETCWFGIVERGVQEIIFWYTKSLRGRCPSKLWCLNCEKSDGQTLRGKDYNQRNTRLDWWIVWDWFHAGKTMSSLPPMTGNIWEWSTYIPPRKCYGLRGWCKWHWFTYISYFVWGFWQAIVTGGSVFNQRSYFVRWDNELFWVAQMKLKPGRELGGAFPNSQFIWTAQGWMNIPLRVDIFVPWILTGMMSRYWGTVLQ